MFSLRGKLLEAHSYIISLESFHREGRVLCVSLPCFFWGERAFILTKFSFITSVLRDTNGRNTGCTATLSGTFCPLQVFEKEVKRNWVVHAVYSVGPCSTLWVVFILEICCLFVEFSYDCSRVRRLCFSSCGSIYSVFGSCSWDWPMFAERPNLKSKGGLTRGVTHNLAIVFLPQNLIYLFHSRSCVFPSLAQNCGQWHSTYSELFEPWTLPRSCSDILFWRCFLLFPCFRSNKS